MANKTETKVDENPTTNNNDSKGSKCPTWLPILLSSLLSIVAIFIAFCANKLSIQANSLANQANDIYKDELSLTHRPYVWIENHASIDDKNYSVNDPNTVQLIVINSPARITSELHRHYMKKGDELIEIDKKEYDNRILYPSEKTQYTYTIDQSSVNRINDLLKEGYELFRESKVKYQMLSKAEIYNYEAKWRFEEKGKAWKLTENPIAN